MRDDENSASAADGALRQTSFLKGMREYLPRKCSCAAVLGSWTGTGRRKRPLQGNHVSGHVSSRDYTQAEQRTGTDPEPGEERGEGQRRPGPAHSAPGSPGSSQGPLGGSAPWLILTADTLSSEHHLRPHGGGQRVWQRTGQQAWSTRAGRLRHPNPNQADVCACGVSWSPGPRASYRRCQQSSTGTAHFQHCHPQQHMSGGQQASL